MFQRRKGGKKSRHSRGDQASQNSAAAATIDPEQADQKADQGWVRDFRIEVIDRVWQGLNEFPQNLQDPSIRDETIAQLKTEYKRLKTELKNLRDNEISAPFTVVLEKEVLLAKKPVSGRGRARVARARESALDSTLQNTPINDLFSFLFKFCGNLRKKSPGNYDWLSEQRNLHEFSTNFQIFKNAERLRSAFYQYLPKDVVEISDRLKEALAYVKQANIAQPVLQAFVKSAESAVLELQRIKIVTELVISYIFENKEALKAGAENIVLLEIRRSQRFPLAFGDLTKSIS
jgi:hypothetical protein